MATDEQATWTIPPEGSPLAAAYALGYAAGLDAKAADHHLASPEHSFVAGQVAGLLMKAGLQVWPEYDEEGIYRPSMSISEDEDSPRLRILALPPEVPDAGA